MRSSDWGYTWGAVVVQVVVGRRRKAAVEVVGGVLSDRAESQRGQLVLRSQPTAHGAHYTREKVLGSAPPLGQSWSHCQSPKAWHWFIIYAYLFFSQDLVKLT